MNRPLQLAILATIVGLWLPAAPLLATGAAHQIINDPPFDACIRLTDDGGDGPCNPSSQGLPDLTQMKLGRFAPTSPVVDLFDGAWSNSGGFLRFDVSFKGLVNPPGPLGYDWEYPVYAPFLYGTNPVFGWIELDADQDEDTGGELAFPQLRYLGNAARFGGKPSGSRFADRVAEDASAFDGNILTSPYVECSGEEFHISFIAEDIDSITIVQEKPGGNPAVFETGEVWLVHGRLFHRAHGFSEFAFMCPWGEGEYMPSMTLRFEHDLPSDRTTISLVYPLTNAACASMNGPSTPVEEMDGCADNQHSVEEALTDLKFSATWATYFDRLNPDFRLISAWESNTVSGCLSPAAWRVEALVGTAYGQQQPDNSHYIWTDVWPNPKVGDFDGNNAVDGLDTAKFYLYLETHDGLPGWDDDGDFFNSQISLHDFASNFSLYDTNHDGLVHPNDLFNMGDMDLDGDVDYADIDDFILALLDPEAYQAGHEGVSPATRGDLNGDFMMDGADVAGFVDAVLEDGVRSASIKGRQDADLLILK